MNTGHETDAVQAVFARHGLRCTRQRRSLYEALAATDKHPTADDLHRSLAAASQDVSLATVYNTLEAFCDAGLALKIPGKGASARYDATTHDHLHLRDRKTGQVIDLPQHLSDKLLAHLPADVLEHLGQQMGFKIAQVQIELVGEKVSD